MATLRKTVNTLDITLADSQGKDTVFKIDNPKSTTTRQDVDNVFAPIIEAGILYSRYENPFTSVKAVQKSTVVTTIEELN